MSQKQITLFSLLAVVACAVALNELIVSGTDEDKNRGVASFGERFEPQQIKWEQELARTVSATPNSKTLLAKKPNLQDRLLFEVFKGHYEAKLTEGRIQKIFLAKDQIPLKLATKELVENYGSLMKNFVGYEVTTQGGNDLVSLKNPAGDKVGTIIIRRDDEGRVLEIESQ